MAKQIISTRTNSEKYIERTLVKAAKALGGRALKFYSGIETGYPDRLVMMPGGKIAWVELKSKGEKPTKVQAIRHQELKDLGFQVRVIDNANDAAELPGRMVGDEL